MPAAPTGWTIQRKGTTVMGQLLRGSHPRQHDQHHPDQPIPDQPPPDSQIASVGPLDAAPGVEVGQERASRHCFRVRPRRAISGDRAGRQSLDEVLGQSPALGR